MFGLNYLPLRHKKNIKNQNVKIKMTYKNPKRTGHILHFGLYFLYFIFDILFFLSIRCTLYAIF